MGLNYYEILGVDSLAPETDIKIAFRKLALQHNAPTFLNSKQNKEFSLICEAYDVLSKPKTRILYDLLGEEGIKSGSTRIPEGCKVKPYAPYSFHGDPARVWREFLATGGLSVKTFSDANHGEVSSEVDWFGSSIQYQTSNPEPKVVDVYITLEEAFYGCTKNVSFPKRAFDNNGELRLIKESSVALEIPRGCPENRRFVFYNVHRRMEKVDKLEQDLVVVVKVIPHEKFQLSDHDLLVKKTIPLGLSLTGCIIEVDTIDGKILHLVVQRVVKPGQRLLVPSEGMPFENSDQRGDMIVELEVDFPPKIDEKQVSLVNKALK